MEDGLIRDLRGTRVWRKAGSTMVDMLLGIFKKFEVDRNERRGTVTQFVGMDSLIVNHGTSADNFHGSIQKAGYTRMLVLGQGNF